jgi:hypothetical protein
MAADKWPQEEYEISLEPRIGFAVAGDTSCVAGLGVRCYTTDTNGQLTVMLATTRQGWGIALATVATAGLTFPIVLRGLVKVLAGGTYTRDLAVAFDSSGYVVALADQACNEAGSATYTVYYSAKIGRALMTGTQSGDEILIYLNP